MTSIFKNRFDKENSFKGLYQDFSDILSANTKTGVSINFPVSTTCKPTAVCSKVCYACKSNSFMMMDNAVKKSVRNYEYFQTTDVETIAQRIAKEFAKYKKRTKNNVLRWNGVGDLFDKSVEVINYMASVYGIVHLIYSRKPDMINKLIDSPNISVLYSLDNSNWQRWIEVKRKNTGFTFLREDNFLPDNVPINIIFPVKQKHKEIPIDSKDCPCDRGTIELKDACANCKLCLIGK
jgi:hypothetical protein